MKPWPSPTPDAITFPVAKPDIQEQDVQRVLIELKKGNVSGATPTIQEAESLLKNILKADCLVVSNGSVALVLALRALGVGSGDEILVPNLTYAATASSVVNVGAKPVFCDSDSTDWNISLESAKEALTDQTKAIILVDLYGVTRDWSPMIAWAQTAGLKVIHDCAESLTASWLGSPSGSRADIRTYSFFANKLITSGEGGAVATHDPDLLRKMRILRGQGMSEEVRYWFELPGYNFRMSSMQAALLNSQLERISDIEKQRSELFKKYDEVIGVLGSRPQPPPEAHYSPWMYTTLLSSPIEPRTLAQALAKRGVETRPVFYPLDLMPAFANYKSRTNTPIALGIHQRGISLPTWTGWSEPQLYRLIEMIELSIDESR